MGKQLTREVGTPVAVGVANAEGVAHDFARRDHEHQGTILATGTYTGNGLATLAVIGVGFRPRKVKIWRQADRTWGSCQAADQDAGMTTITNMVGMWQTYVVDYIISMDADGFTVGDGSVGNTFNIADEVYIYIAFK